MICCLLTLFNTIFFVLLILVGPTDQFWSKILLRTAPFWFKQKAIWAGHANSLATSRRYRYLVYPKKLILRTLFRNAMYAAFLTWETRSSTSLNARKFETRAVPLCLLLSFKSLLCFRTAVAQMHRLKGVFPLDVVRESRKKGAASKHAWSAQVSLCFNKNRALLLLMFILFTSYLHRVQCPHKIWQ